MNISSADFCSLTLQEVLDCMITNKSTSGLLYGMVDDELYRVTVNIQKEGLRGVNK